MWVSGTDIASYGAIRWPVSRQTVGLFGLDAANRAQTHFLGMYKTEADRTEGTIIGTLLCYAAT